MKGAILILLSLTASAALILLTLDRLMGNQNNISNGFSRKFAAVDMNLVNEFRLEKGLYQIAGQVAGRKIYLQTAKASELMALDISNNSISSKTIAIPAIDKLEPIFSTVLRYPQVYITGANARKLVRGNLETGEVNVFDINTGPLLSAEIIDEEHVITRSVDTTTFDLKFHKINYAKNKINASANVSPVKSEDMFAYDGVLNFDTADNKFWYLNYYCNGIAIFDSSLNIQRFRSIDTMSTPKVAITHSEASITHNKPPLTVNKTGFVHGGKLYVQSVLKADNEMATGENTVVDVYGPEYEGSFYIPVSLHEFVDAEFLDDNKMAVLLKDRLLVFTFKSLLQ